MDKQQLGGGDAADGASLYVGSTVIMAAGDRERERGESTVFLLLFEKAKCPSLPASSISSLHFSLSLSCSAEAFDVKRSTVISASGLFVQQLRSAVCWDAKHTFVFTIKRAD